MEKKLYEQCLALLQDAVQREDVHSVTLLVYQLVFDTSNMVVGTAFTIESLAHVVVDAINEHHVTLLDISSQLTASKAA